MSNWVRSVGLKALWLAALLAGLTVAGVVQAEGLSGTTLVNAVRQGGYVLVMRHASSPQTPPTADAAEPGNTKLERQLDDTGRSTARAMGTATKALGIPIGQVWSSPTYRALETVRLAGLPAPTVADELGDAGQSMQAVSGSQSVWLSAAALLGDGDDVGPRQTAIFRGLHVAGAAELLGAFGQIPNPAIRATLVKLAKLIAKEEAVAVGGVSLVGA